MPELPEVETVRRILDSKLRGKEFKEVRIFFNKIIKDPGVSAFRKELIGQKINRVEKKAKYLLFMLDDYVLISHLRMEGKYFFAKKNDPGDFKHILVIFEFTDGSELRYHDTRRFGTMQLQPLDEYLTSDPIQKLGYEPFDHHVTVDYLKENWAKKTIAIKSTILEQTVIAGIGNIYANEILFRAKIDPTTPTNKLTDEQLQAIIDCSRKILSRAIELGGTTISSYHPEPGVDGKFKNELLVHSHADEPCPVCGNKIVKYKLNGRGTYICPNCQH